MGLAQPLRITAILLMFGLVIAFHELGHFGACKLFNIKTPVFSLGFGPALVQKKIGETIFQISMLPFGGYVSINVHDIQQAPYWQKMIIALAGIANNLLLGMLVLFLLLYLHRAHIQTTQTLLSIAQKTRQSFVHIVKNSVAIIGGIFFPQKDPHAYKSSPLISILPHIRQQRLASFLYFVSVINLELGIFNVLPIPMLDGGQALHYTITALVKTVAPGAGRPLIHFVYLLIFVGFLLYLNRKALKKEHLS